MNWKCIHIFYYDNHDFLIREGIYPILLKNQIENFFFIRYWENGPHVRLRIKNIKEDLFKKVKNEICDFIEKSPSKLVIDENKYTKTALEYGKKEKNFTNNMGIIANNTVKDWIYEPELEKYHGTNGVAIAENEFIYSSKLVAKILLSKPSASKKYFFGSVFALLILNDICNSNSDINNFLCEYIEYWKKFSGIHEESFLKIQDQIKNYSINPESIKTISQFYESNSFRSIHKEIFDKLKNLFNNPPKSFYFNFIHLFNNRMGMAPAEEIIISFLGKKILGEVDYDKL